MKPAISRWLMFAVTLVVVSSLFTACDGDDDVADPTPAPPTSVPTSAATQPPQTETGIDAVDRAIAAVAVRDPDTLSALIRPMRLACTNVTGAGGPPQCSNAPGTPPEGTIVEAFPYGTCEREWQFDLAAFVERFLPRLGELYAAVRIDQYTPSEELPDGGYAVIYTDGEGFEASHALVLDDNGIIAADTLCGGVAERFLADAPPFNDPDVLLEGPAFE